MTAPDQIVGRAGTEALRLTGREFHHKRTVAITVTVTTAEAIVVAVARATAIEAPLA
jgi:hypothetical protein